MQLQNASKLDKNDVVKFCSNTFSWGDYIPEIWKYWHSEGNLYVIRENNVPVALCHTSISKKDNQVWIEGIRVNPNFRRRGCASTLVKHSEKQAKNHHCIDSFMLIETNNKNSLMLSQKLGYIIKEKWNFFSLLPEKSESIPETGFTKMHTPSFDLLSSDFLYVDSWRWYPLKTDTISLLVNNRQIIYLAENNKYSMAVITFSKHFTSTMIVTLLFGTKSGIEKLLNFSKHLAFMKNFKRIQVLTKLSSMNDLQNIEKKLSFYLMWKKL